MNSGVTYSLERLAGLLRDRDLADLDLRRVDDLLQREGRRGQPCRARARRRRSSQPRTSCSTVRLTSSIVMVRSGCSPACMKIVSPICSTALRDAEPAAVRPRRADGLDVLDDSRADASASTRRDSSCVPARLRDRRRGCRTPCAAGPRSVRRRTSAHRFGRDVPEIVQDVHALVVAEQHVDAAARPARLALEPHQQIHQPARTSAPRSRKSPVCTSRAVPPLHFCSASIKPAAWRICARLGPAPWTSPTATMRGPAGACGCAAGGTTRRWRRSAENRQKSQRCRAASDAGDHIEARAAR